MLLDWKACMLILLDICLRARRLWARRFLAPQPRIVGFQQHRQQHVLRAQCEQADGNERDKLQRLLRDAVAYEGGRRGEREESKASDDSGVVGKADRLDSPAPKI